MAKKAHRGVSEDDWLEGVEAIRVEFRAASSTSQYPPPEAFLLHTTPYFSLTIFHDFDSQLFVSVT